MEVEEKPCTCGFPSVIFILYFLATPEKEGPFFLTKEDDVTHSPAESKIHTGERTKEIIPSMSNTVGCQGEDGLTAWKSPT